MKQVHRLAMSVDSTLPFICHGKTRARLLRSHHGAGVSGLVGKNSMVGKDHGDDKKPVVGNSQKAHVGKWINVHSGNIASRAGGKFICCIAGSFLLLCGNVGLAAFSLGLRNGLTNLGHAQCTS